MAEVEINPSNLLGEIQEARAELERARKEVSAAHQRECGVLNRLNELQKKWDMLTEKLKVTSPAQTNWHTDRYSRPVVG